MAAETSYLSEDEFPYDSEDPIRPTPEDNESDGTNHWTYIPIRKKSHTQKSFVSFQNDSLKRIRKNAKKTKKNQHKSIRQRLEQNKYRWTRGEPSIIDDSYKKLLENAIATFFKSGYETYWNDGKSASLDEIIDVVRNILIKYKLIVSGGFILKNMGLSVEDMSKPSVDIDIYVPYPIPNRYPEFYETMAKLFNCDIQETSKGKTYTINKFISSGKSSKHSFFQKNGIYSVFKHQRNIDGLYAEMDLVRSVNGKSPVSIVKNFDLSVCMNWYDGKNVYVMDMDGIMKEGISYLNYSYVPLLLGIKNNQGTPHQPNPVTRDRILKYILRGYRIQFLHPFTGNMTEIHIEDLLNSVNRLPSNKRNKVKETYHLSFSSKAGKYPTSVL